MLSRPFQNTPARLLMRRCVAAIQLLVMLLLAVPACCYDLDATKTAKQPGISASAGAMDAGHDSCPCCPDEGQKDSSSDTCATCSYCSLYAPLAGVITINYSPVVADLVITDPLVRFPEVHLSIFVPPQNLA